MGQTAKTYVATVQVLISLDQDVNNETEAADWFSGLLTDNPGVWDWGYLKIGGQYMYPSEKNIDIEEYEEGDFLL